MKYKTNDGAVVDSKQATSKFKGAFKKGRVSQFLLHDPIGGYYLIDHLEKSVEWYCDELAIAWFKTNGFFEMAEELRAK